MFGIGTAILAGRFLALAERVSQLDLERGEFVNDLSGRVESTWAVRARRNAIANIHELAQELRPWVAWPLVLTVILIVASVLPLAGVPMDVWWFRAIVITLLVVTSIIWVLLLWRLLSGVVGVTESSWRERRREQDKLRAEGKGFLVSGHPDDLVDGVARAQEFFQPGFLSTRRGKRWEKRMRRQKPPRV